MRIKSSFKDYYDSGLQYGIDDDLLYVREKRVITTPYQQYWRETNRLNGRSCVAFTIYFCGKAYRGYRIGEKYCYSLEDVDKVAAHLPAKEHKAYLNNQDMDGYTLQWRRDGYEYMRRWQFGQYFRHPDYPIKRKSWQNHKEDNADEYAAEYCLKHRTPIFYFASEGGLKYEIANPILREYQFIKVKDPFTAFQELSAWIGNLANLREVIPPISNSDMIQSKGFDLKTSFRKDKQKKK